MSPVSEIGNPPPVQPPPGGGHGDHGTDVANPNASTGQSFSTVLAQTIGQASGVSAYANHSDSSGPGAIGASYSDAHTATTSTQNEGSHPKHFTIGGSNHGGDHGFQETVLGLRAYRQQLIASNIANADTPGYKAVDIDFQAALRIARSAAKTPPLMLSSKAPGHIFGQAKSSALPYPLKDHTPSQPSVDGNTVEMDVERSKFTENAVMWEFSRDRVSSHYKMTMEMLQSLNA